MSALRTIIDAAVADAIAAHPKYFTPKGAEFARTVIVRKIMAGLLRDDGDARSSEEPAAPEQPTFFRAPKSSREARGYVALRIIAGAVPPQFNVDDIIIMRSAYREAVFALADVSPTDQWPFLTDRKMIAAWSEFFRETLGDVPRRSIFQMRGDVSGIVMPSCWPPRKDGHLYDTEEEAA
jgi:hypothetical protein